MKKERSTNELRWVERCVPQYEGADFGSVEKVLQQKLEITDTVETSTPKQGDVVGRYEDEFIRTSYEWRDIPLVEVEGEE